MPQKSAIANITNAAVEEMVKPVVREAVKQVKPMPTESVRMLYGDFGQGFPTEEQLGKQRDFHRIQDAQQLHDTRQKHAAMLGGTPKPFDTPIPFTTPEQRPIANVFDDSKPTTEVSAQVMQTAVRDQFETAKNLGTTNQNTDEQEKRKKEEIEAQEKAKREAEERQRLEMHIEAPPGRVTGLSFKRKKSASRMRPLLKSAETRASLGIGG